VVLPLCHIIVNNEIFKHLFEDLQGYLKGITNGANLVPFSYIDVPPNSLRDPNVGPKVKHRKIKKSGHAL
jgi:hypothetical protein